MENETLEMAKSKLNHTAEEMNEDEGNNEGKIRMTTKKKNTGKEEEK